MDSRVEAPTIGLQLYPNQAERIQLNFLVLLSTSVLAAFYEALDMGYGEIAEWGRVAFSGIVPAARWKA